MARIAQTVSLRARALSIEPHKWVLVLGALAMLIDIMMPHPKLAVESEFPHSARLPPNPYLAGFVNERQWLFAHRKFRNRCVLEALAASERAEQDRNVASDSSDREMSPIDLASWLTIY